MQWMPQFEAALDLTQQLNLAREVRANPPQLEPVKTGVSFLTRTTADPRLVRITVTVELAVHRPSSAIASLLQSCLCFPVL